MVECYIKSVSVSEILLNNYLLYICSDLITTGIVVVLVSMCVSFYLLIFLVHGGPHRIEYLSLSISSPSFVDKFCIYFFIAHQVVPSYTHMTPSGTQSLIDIAMLK